MGFATLFFLALGLSMDAFAVSVSNGMCYRGIGRKEAIITAFTFGVFQALMPVAGYFGGRFFSEAISSLDHWIALILLCFIGGSMVLESFKEMRNQDSDCCCGKKEFTLRVLIVQGIATSIDALAVGISFAVMKTNIVSAAAFIGIITFLCCVFGAALGKRFGLLLGQRAKVFGGLILIGIGVKIFLEHTLGI